MITKTPSVAVLLAAHNGHLWIEEQINSILFQKNISLEIFISCDLSDDNTFDICQNYAKKYSKITLLPYGNFFGGAANNFFHLIKNINILNYDYISLSDQDDIWNKIKLSEAINVIKKKNLDGYSSNVIAFWPNGKEKLLKKSYPQKKLDYFFESAGPGCTYVFKSHSINEFKEFLLENWNKVSLVELHDWLIYAFFRFRDMKWFIDERSLTHYRQHGKNQFGSNFGLKAYLNRFFKVKNKWYRNEIKKIIYLVDRSSQKSISLKSTFLLRNIYHLRRRPRDIGILLFIIIFKIF